MSKKSLSTKLIELNRMKTLGAPYFLIQDKKNEILLEVKRMGITQYDVIINDKNSNKSKLLELCAGKYQVNCSTETQSISFTLIND